MHPFTLLALATVVFFLQKMLSWLSSLLIGFILRFSAESAQLAQLKQQACTTTKQKNALSPQDQYAKWTKLNRQLDSLAKQIEEYEQLLVAKRETYASLTTTLGRLLMVGSYILKFWFRGQSVFFMPNVFPVPIVQRCWASGVSVSVWLFLLGRVVSGVEFIVASM